MLMSTRSCLMFLSWMRIVIIAMANFRNCTIGHERYIGVEEAHNISGLSPWTWRRWAYVGKIASVKAGRRLLIPVSEIQRIMQEGMRPRSLRNSQSDDEQIAKSL